jgi:hypothetical protein
MKYLFALLFISTLFSCQSRKAQNYLSLLDSTDRKIFRILIDKQVEDKRLEALIADKPDLALSLAKQQVDSLKTEIAKVESLHIDHLPDALPLKKSVRDYYNTVLRLKEVDIMEAQLLSGTLSKDTIKAQKAQSELINLARKRLTIHTELGNLEQQRNRAKVKFEETNGLKD